MNRSFLIGLGLAAASLSYSVIRLDASFPNVTDAQYLANAAQFPAVGKLSNNGSFGATLINDEWVITAGHVLASGGTGTVTINNIVYTITSAVRHPSYTSSNIANGFDVALAKISPRVIDTKPLGIHTAAWPGLPVWMVGFGLTGTGLVGNQGGAGVKRAGTNILESYPDLPNIAFTDFDNGNALNNFQGTATPTTYEGQMASGDSGGAYIVEEGGEFKIIGVNSFVARLDGATTYSLYGASSGATRIAPILNWVNTTINNGSAGKVSGKISVDSQTTGFLGQQLEITLKSTSNVVLEPPFTVPLAFDGSYSFTTSQRGTIWVGFKSPNSMRAYLTSVTVTNGWLQNQNISLYNGDCDNNNVVDLTDYTIIAVGFNGLLDSDPNTTGNQSSANWNPLADLNKDGVTDLTDYTIVATNFNIVGSP